MRIETVELRRLSLERAYRIAPPEYLGPYKWILEHAGSKAQKLPSTQNNLDPGFDVKLVAQRGIHKPGGFTHALTIKSAAHDQYDDGIIEQDDGTWILRYRQQEKGDTSKNSNQDIYNESLRACLRDGLPVGVFVSSPSGASLYDCMGLAFVEAYDPESGVFTLHGPVEENQPAGYWSIISDADIAPADAELLETISEKDERIIKMVERAQRVRQNKFREALLWAYEDRCAITSYDVPETLQAAHISSYMGPKSQITTNGLLLRADLHLLYDSYLISVDPEDHRVHMASRLLETPYCELNKQVLRNPRSNADRPSDARLRTHFSEFRLRNELRRAAAAKR